MLIVPVDQMMQDHGMRSSAPTCQRHFQSFKYVNKDWRRNTIIKSKDSPGICDDFDCDESGTLRNTIRVASCSAATHIG